MKLYTSEVPLTCKECDSEIQPNDRMTWVFLREYSGFRFARTRVPYCESCVQLLLESNWPSGSVEP